MLQSHNQKMNESTDSKTKRVDVTDSKDSKTKRVDVADSKTKRVDVNKVRKPQPVSRQPSTEPTEAVEAEVLSPEQKALGEERLQWIKEMNAKYGSSGWDDVELDGNVFEIHSGHPEHERTRLISFGQEGHGGMGLWQRGDGYPCIANGYWKLKSYDTIYGPVYTITSVQNAPMRIARHSPGWNASDVGLYENGCPQDWDLWYIVKSEDQGKYCIFSYVDPNQKLAQWGNGQHDWGTYWIKEKTQGDWFLTPRFKVTLDLYTIWTCDNRTGSRDITHENSDTVGIKLTKSTTIATKTELKVSMKYALNAGIAVEGVGEFGESAEIETMLDETLDTSMTSTVEKDWSRTVTDTFTVPAGKHYRIRGLKTNFIGNQNDDDCMEMFTESRYYKIEESDSDGIFRDIPGRSMVEGVDFTSKINE